MATSNMKIKPYFWEDNTGNSVYPPTSYLTFSPWIYMVPQYQPINVLMLGVAGATVAGLIRLLYGNIPITGVDIKPMKINRYNINFIQADAKEYVKTCGKFDTVIVDLFETGTSYNCNFITTKEFADNLTRIANYIIINTLKNPNLSVYSHLKKIGVNKPSGGANLIHYFEVNKIPHLKS